MRVKPKARFVKIPPAQAVIAIRWRPYRRKHWFSIQIFGDRVPEPRPIYRPDCNFPVAVKVHLLWNKTLIELLPPVKRGGEIRVLYIPAPVEI